MNRLLLFVVSLMVSLAVLLGISATAAALWPDGDTPTADKEYPPPEQPKDFCERAIPTDAQSTLGLVDPGDPEQSEPGEQCSVVGKEGRVNVSVESFTEWRSGGPDGELSRSWESRTMAANRTLAEDCATFISIGRPTYELSPQWLGLPNDAISCAWASDGVGRLVFLAADGTQVVSVDAFVPTETTATQVRDGLSVVARAVDEVLA